MKRIIVLLGIGSVLLVVALAIMAGEIKGLKSEADLLQSRLANLEKQVSELNSFRMYPATCSVVCGGGLQAARGLQTIRIQWHDVLLRARERKISDTQVAG